MREALSKTHCRRRKRSTEADADQILNDKGVIVVPDVLANGGGVSFLFRVGSKPHGILLVGRQVNAKHDAR